MNRMYAGIVAIMVSFAAAHATAGAPPTTDTGQALVRAWNQLEPTEDGAELVNRRHRVTFGPSGEVVFEPSTGGPWWHWRLVHLAIGSHQLMEGDARPMVEGLAVKRRHGAVREEYHAGLYSIEQRFVIEERPTVAGDVRIRGRIESDGVFEAGAHRWEWHTDAGVVFLGDVTVFDAHGLEIEAEMSVTASSSEIVIAAEALADAAFPVTIDPEIGSDDFRISFMGGTGTTLHRAETAAIAYNSGHDEFLVVWIGTEWKGDLIDAPEIYGQRIDAATGALVGERGFRISDIGPPIDYRFRPWQVAVAYNSKRAQYLVAFSANANEPGMDPDEREIYIQIVDHDGHLIGSRRRISTQAGLGRWWTSATDPDVAYNSVNDEYFVVWRGYDEAASDLHELDEQIYGQRVTALGLETGLDDHRLTFHWCTSAMQWVRTPAVAYNHHRNEYLVTYTAMDNNPYKPLGLNEVEVFATRVRADATGLGTGHTPISDVGGGWGDDRGTALYPDVVYNQNEREYLVVWHGDDEPAGEVEVFGQRIDQLGREVGANDFRISSAGPEGDGRYSAEFAAVSHDPLRNQYLVTWRSDGSAPGQLLVDDDFEIHGQYLDGTSGGEVGGDDFRISSFVSPLGETLSAGRPAVAHSIKSGVHLVAFDGEGDALGMAPHEREIFGQRLTPHGCSWLVGHPHYCRDCGPCQAGQADCDNGSECATGLCSHDVGSEYGLPSYYDVCEPMCPYPKGHPDYCRYCGPCFAGQADCDHDGECAPGLICRHDVGELYHLPAKYDVCEVP